MNPDVAKKLLNELLPQLEALETQCSGVIELLKAKELITDDELAPYLDQAGKASNVRWRATRLRIEHLVSTVLKEESQPAETSPRPAAPDQQAEAQEVQKEKVEQPGKEPKQEKTARRDVEPAPIESADKKSTQPSTESPEKEQAAPSAQKKDTDAEPGAEPEPKAA